MIQACLDTSINIASFRLLEDGEVIASLDKECLRGVSKLLPEIVAEIKSSGISVAEVGEWYVGIGPGSFTGLRVGISFIKGICAASGAKYSGVNSGFAYLKGLDDEEKITVLHDGRKKEVICNSFIRQDGFWIENEVEVRAIEDLNKLSDTGPFVTVMDEELLDGVESVSYMKSLSPESFAGAIRELPLDELSMSMSCEPIYVRPPVFVKPVVKLNN
ncbi:MAG: tRNA (adenosine(37)-N6)-threonylcarbamoyltransferase complex dimerization subunit type 1 TsaB [Lentisphaeraceae bacterium]|nr:tRNA (adenosine(37)-N6)-threonylcarbamoyltransferase complex dimerization subunit type 1 TsaB [Lentisphaeraceae bacterium]